VKLTEFCVGSAQPKNESEMERYMRLASSKGIEVLCFPEGFLDSHKSVEKLLELAKDCGIWVVTGYDEMGETEEGFQSAIIVNDQGRIVGKHKKTYLSTSEIEDRRTVGDKLDVFNTEFGKFGVVICAEILCPEVTRVLCLKGAEIIFHPVGVGMDNQLQYDSWKSLIQVRAIENILYFVVSTHDKASRRTKDGTSRPLGLIVNSGGKILAEAKNSKLISAVLDLSKRDEDARKGAFYGSFSNRISRRRPELYSVLASSNLSPTCQHSHVSIDP